MSVWVPFLSALPAILGILGFVIFLLLRAMGKGDPITNRIVDKLRQQHPEKFSAAKVTSQQLYKLLSQDQVLQKVVGRQDYELMKQALKQ